MTREECCQKFRDFDRITEMMRATQFPQRGATGWVFDCATGVRTIVMQVEGATAAASERLA